MEGENNLMKKNMQLSALGIVVIILAILLYWYLSREVKDTSVPTTEETVEILSQTPEVQVETNPK